MLFSLTLWIDFIAMSFSLWMAFYLLGRGFPSRITLRAVIVLAALSAFFLGAAYNIFHQIPGSASLRAILLVVVLATWYSLTGQLRPKRLPKKTSLLSVGLYGLAVVVIIILLGTRSAFVREEGNALWVAHMGVSLPFVLYGIFQVLACTGILINLLSGPRIGLSSQGIYFFTASLMPIGSVGYGVLALAIPTSLPRLIQDGLVFAGVCLLGYSVARHQTLVERRTTLQEFPLTGLALLGLAAIYAWLAWHLGYQPEVAALVMALAIITHSIYDLVREFLERQRYRNDSVFRKQLRQLEALENNQETQSQNLQKGLELLCQTIGAHGGCIAECQGEDFIVTASHQSLPTGSRLPLEAATCAELYQPVDPLLAEVDWMAPAFTGNTQVALLAVSAPHSRVEYSPEDLDMLVEVADQVGIAVALARLRPDKTDRIRQLVSEAHSQADGLRSSAEALIATLVTNPEADFVHMVEDALRRLFDTIALGQHPLLDRIHIGGANHVERGRNLQQHLVQAIEALHPVGARPAEPLPREWFNYVVLYDAYVECVPNREIMARMYISEGTFNRTRRNALRGLARLLLEKKKGRPSG